MIPVELLCSQVNATEWTLAGTPVPITAIVAGEFVALFEILTVPPCEMLSWARKSRSTVHSVRAPASSQPRRRSS